MRSQNPHSPQAAACLSTASCPPAPPSQPPPGLEKPDGGAGGPQTTPPSLIRLPGPSTHLGFGESSWSLCCSRRRPRAPQGGWPGAVGSCWPAATLQNIEFCLWGWRPVQVGLQIPATGSVFSLIIHLSFSLNPERREKNLPPSRQLGYNSEGALDLKLNHLIHSPAPPCINCVTSDKCINLPEPVSFVSSHFKAWFYQAIENRLESCWHLIILKTTSWDFPGGPEAKTLYSLCKGPMFDPWSGN